MAASFFFSATSSATVQVCVVKDHKHKSSRSTETIKEASKTGNTIAKQHKIQP
ncbi:hypothetical protein COLO4_29604 [Corchorus olitorius]|uniref:Uncharacterized protein n=1 Tax=Corchorus olitorius TaxID=93759 RepID=A0A1R3HDW0_9ROSI|nr:hypothetical protein COLO4_29604 [Corchorus olitorius]